jgi:hypothetical protein
MSSTLSVVDTEFQAAVLTQGIQTRSCGSSGYLIDHQFEDFFFAADQYKDFPISSAEIIP